MRNKPSYFAVFAMKRQLEVSLFYIDREINELRSREDLDWSDYSVRLSDDPNELLEQLFSVKETLSASMAALPSFPKKKWLDSLKIRLYEWSMVERFPEYYESKRCLR